MGRRIERSNRIAATNMRVLFAVKRAVRLRTTKRSDMPTADRQRPCSILSLKFRKAMLNQSKQEDVGGIPGSHRAV